MVWVFSDLQDPNFMYVNLLFLRLNFGRAWNLKSLLCYLCHTSLFCKLILLVSYNNKLLVLSLVYNINTTTGRCLPFSRVEIIWPLEIQVSFYCLFISILVLVYCYFIAILLLLHCHHYVYRLWIWLGGLLCFISYYCVCFGWFSLSSCKCKKNNALCKFNN